MMVEVVVEDSRQVPADGVLHFVGHDMHDLLHLLVHEGTRQYMGQARIPDSGLRLRPELVESQAVGFRRQAGQDFKGSGRFVVIVSVRASRAVDSPAKPGDFTVTVMDAFELGAAGIGGPASLTADAIGETGWNGVNGDRSLAAGDPFRAVVGGKVSLDTLVFIDFAVDPDPTYTVVAKSARYPGIGNHACHHANAHVRGRAGVDGFGVRRAGRRVLPDQG